MTKPPSTRPLSIKVIAVLFLLQVLAAAGGAFITRQHLLVGFPLTGWSAVVCSLLLGGLYLYASLGLWRLRETARRLGIVLEAYKILNGVLGVLNPAYRDIYVQEMVRKGVPEASILPLLTISWILAVAGAVILGGVVIWFLIKRKAAFVKPATSQA